VKINILVDLMTASNEDLFKTLEELQTATEQLMMEGWKRKIHTDLAQHAMKFQSKEYKPVRESEKDGKTQ
jgi:hypothetical protein